MTPLTTYAEGTPQFRYNESICSARNPIERLFGVLKATWRCLSRQRVLMYNPGFSGRIVNACSVLHNLRLNERSYNTEDSIFEPHNIDDLTESSPQLSASSEAKRVQSRLIANYFSN